MRKKLDKNGKEIRESSNTSFINVIKQSNTQTQSSQPKPDEKK